MSKIKIKWVVSPAPTGPYRSFEHRSWPTAFYADSVDEELCARISCEADYNPRRVRENDHPPLTLYVRDYSVEGWCWRKVKREFSTLKELKDSLQRILRANPQIAPRELTIRS